MLSRLFQKNRRKQELWWSEPIYKNLVLRAKISEIIVSCKSEFQKIQILKTEPFGHILVIDGYAQSSEFDDSTYHESLVHPILLLHSKPEYVLIAGGGELATAREVLKHNTVKKLVMVDIDKKVVEVCRKYLGKVLDTEWIFDDPRFELVIDDAENYVKKTKEKFDVVIMDIVDPLAHSQGNSLYYVDFYKQLKKIMNEKSMLVTQSGPCGKLTHTESFTVIHNTLKKCFDNILPYSVYMQTFADMWGFNIAWNEFEIKNLTSDYIDYQIQKRIDKKLYFFDGIGFIGQITLPSYLRINCANEKRIICPAEI